MKPYRGLVIGAGAIGALLEEESRRPKPATHAGALSRNAKTVLVGIVDADLDALKKAKKLFPKARTFSNVQDALSELKPDIVAIATPPSSHLELLRTCIEHNVKMIVCEKPVASSVEEAEEMRTLLSGSDTTFVLNYQRRFFELFRDVKHKIFKGDLGKIQHVTCYYSNGLYNNGGHTADALEFLLSEPIVSAIAEAVEGSHPVMDLCAHAMLRTASGIPITLIPLDQAAYGIHELRLYGTKGKYSITEYGYAVTMAPVGNSLFKQVKQLDYARATRREKKESMVAGSLKEVIAAHESKRKPLSGIENGVRTMAVLDAVAKSAKENGKIISIPETL